MNQWLLKVRRPGGGTSVVDHFETRLVADAAAKWHNDAYQTDTYYVEENHRCPGCRSGEAHHCDAQDHPNGSQT